MTSSTLESTIVVTTEQINLAVEKLAKDRKRFDACMAVLDKPSDINRSIEYRRCVSSSESVDASLRRVCENDEKVMQQAIKAASKMHRPVVLNV